jgi:hypothetical protein
MADATGLVSGRGCGQLVDGIPKAIMLCLVNEVKEQMQGALLDVLYKRDESGNMSVENLLEEDADYTRQKKRCQEFLHLVRSIMMRTKERCACVLPGRRRRRRRRPDGFVQYPPPPPAGQRLRGSLIRWAPACVLRRRLGAGGGATDGVGGGDCPRGLPSDRQGLTRRG